MCKTLDCAYRVVQEVENFVIVVHSLVRNFVGQKRCQKWTTVLDKALGDDIAEHWNQAFVHEHLIVLAFLGIDEQAANCLIQIVEHFFKVCCGLNQWILGRDQVEDLEETVDIAITYAERNGRAFDNEKRKAALEQSLEKDVLFIRF